MNPMLIVPFILSALIPAPKPAPTPEFPRTEAACQSEYPQGLPSSRITLTMLCRKAYLAAHDDSAKIPAWVVYRMTPERAIGCEPRSSRFTPDPDLPAGSRATTKDYAGSGYDMGHMANAADMAWDPDVQAESFLLSNISPQTPNLNRGVWKMLETYVRAWAHDGRSMTIYIGGIYDANSPRIGSGVVVPSKFYKIIVDESSKETLAFMFPNDEKVPTKVDQFATSVGEIERASGTMQPAPGDKTSVSKAWKVDLRALAQDKRNECKG